MLPAPTVLDRPLMFHPAGGTDSSAIDVPKAFQRRTEPFETRAVYVVQRVS